MDEDESELLILWFLTMAAVAIMALRLALRTYRRQRLEMGDYFTMAAIISILLRGAMIHVALVWGTNNITEAARKKIVFTPEVIYRRETGSKLTIVNRVFYTVYTWLQKSVVMCVLRRLLQGLKSAQIVRFYWATLGVTFIIALIVTFVECHPFKLYWQVVPNPGTCSAGTVQLIVFSALNMATDLMLIILPLPQLIKIRRPLMAKIRLIVLFLVGLTIVAVTLTRLLMNLVLFHRSGQSHNVANVEIFFAAFVANAPTIYGLLHIEGRANRSRLEHSHSVNLPASWTASKSGLGQPGAIHTTSNTRHGNESDEQLMIVGAPIAFVSEVAQNSSHLANLARIGALRDPQKLRFSALPPSPCLKMRLSSMHRYF